MSCLGRSLFILQNYHSFCLSPAVPFHYRIFVNYREKNPVLPLLVRCSAEGLMKSIFHAYSTETLQMEWAKCFLLKLKPVQMFLWRFSFSFFFQLSKLTFYLFQYQFFKFPHEQFICGVSSTYLSGFCSSVKPSGLWKNWSNSRDRADSVVQSVTPCHSPSRLWTGSLGGWSRKADRTLSGEKKPWMCSVCFQSGISLCGRALLKFVFWILSEDGLGYADWLLAPSHGGGEMWGIQLWDAELTEGNWNHILPGWVLERQRVLAERMDVKELHITILNQRNQKSIGSKVCEWGDSECLSITVHQFQKHKRKETNILKMFNI